MGQWMTIGVTVAVLVLLGYLCLLRLGTVYWVGKWGYTATTARSKPVRRISPEQLPKVIERFLVGDIYDMLSISWCDDEMESIVLSRSPEAPTLFASFNVADKTPQLESFKAAMAPLGYALEESSEGFNGGFDERFRETALDYSLPRSVTAIIEAVDVALTNLKGSAPEEYYVSASLYVRKLVGKPGFRFRPAKNPLEEILGPR